MEASEFQSAICLSFRNGHRFDFGDLLGKDQEGVSRLGS